MKMIRGVTVTDSVLVSSNVVETAPAAYNGGTTYAAGDQVSVVTGTVAVVYESVQAGNVGHAVSDTDWWAPQGTTYLAYNSGTTYAAGDVVIDGHHEYESLQASNTGHALTDPAWWLDLGNNNRWRMFDQLNSSVTSRPESIEVELDIPGRADSVALLGVLAATIRVTAATDVDGTFYDETFNMVSDSGITDWYAYFFEDIVRRGDLVVTDIPIYAYPTITVEINEPDANAEVGTMVVGQSFDIGEATYGAKLGIQDYSRKVVDEFGNYTLVVRTFSKRASFKTVIDNTKVDATYSTLAQYRSTPVVYVGADEFTASYIYGFYKDMSVEIAYTSKSYVNIEIEGLT